MPTIPETKNSELGQQTEAFGGGVKAQKPMQNVFFSDLNIVKPYPVESTDQEIQYDHNVNTLGKTPEEYYQDIEPTQNLVKDFKDAEPYMRYASEHREYDKGLSAILKLAITHPEDLLKKESEIPPEHLAVVYKDWAKLWQEAHPGIQKMNEKNFQKEGFAGSVANPGNFIPWFITEELPSQLLDFGTHPEQWVAAYGIGKVAPVALNAILSKVSPATRETLLKDLFNWEQKLKGDFETLGIAENTKTSDVIKAWKQKAAEFHPDRGGDAEQFKEVQNAYQNIISARKGSIDKFFDIFRNSTDVQEAVRLSRPRIAMAGQRGSAIVPFERGDIIKTAEGIGKIVNVAGNIATVNVSGKMIDKPLEDISPYQEEQNAKGTGTEVEAGSEQTQGMEQGTEAGVHLRDNAENGMGSEQGKVATWEQGNERPFAFDPNSTKNEGRFRLYPPDKLTDYFRRKSTTPGVSYVMGKDAEGGQVIQAIRFDKSKFTEEQASNWFEQNKGKYKFNVSPEKLPPAEKQVVDRVVGKEGANKPDTDFEPNALEQGIEHEMEHTNSREVAARIAKDHLAEDPEYYRKLKSIMPPGGTNKPPTTVSPGPEEPPTPEEEGGVNDKHLKIKDEAKKNLDTATQLLGDEVENQTGVRMSNEQIIEMAKASEVLRGARTYDKTLELAGQILKTRQMLGELATEGKMSKEFLSTVKAIANTGTDLGRLVQSFKIDALPEYASIQIKIAKDLMKLGHSAEEIEKAAEGVDFKDKEQVTAFYRKFVKPKFSELLDEYAYLNILSSPLTHIVNATSNLIQMAGLNPLTRLATGVVDSIASGMTATERQHYIKEVPAFYKGAFNAIPDAWNGVKDVMAGKSFIERPDVKHIPTGSKLLAWGKPITQALEASDVFFRTMIEKGEEEALLERASSSGKELSDKLIASIQKEAKERANYYVFRAPLDQSNKSGQGDVLSAVDAVSSLVYSGRETIPGFKWFVRFVNTPMNIFKQGIEYSPAGVTTIKGAKDKREQTGKAVVGSLVFAAGYYMAMSGNVSWGVPRNKKEKEAFYAAGRQPYSVKIGDNWVSFSKLGPVSYPLAMAAALNYYQKESPTALSDTDMEKATNALSATMQFFGDQSYVQDIGSMIKAVQGEKGAVTSLLTSIPSQLIPLSSLQRWVNSIIDPLYRKSASGISEEALVDNLQKSIIGASQYIPSAKDIYGKPSEKKMRVLNAVSPMKVSPEDKVGEGILKQTQKAQQLKNFAKKKREEAKEKILGK